MSLQSLNTWVLACRGAVIRYVTCIPFNNNNYYDGCAHDQLTSMQYAYISLKCHALSSDLKDGMKPI